MIQKIFYMLYDKVQKPFHSSQCQKLSPLFVKHEWHFLDNKINKKLSSKLSLMRNNSEFGCTVRKQGKLSLITKKKSAKYGTGPNFPMAGAG